MHLKIEDISEYKKTLTVKNLVTIEPYKEPLPFVNLLKYPYMSSLTRRLSQISHRTICRAP